MSARDVRRIVCLLDGDETLPLDSIARADARLARELHRRWFSQAPLELWRGFRHPDTDPPRLEPTDLVLAGGVNAGVVAAGARNGLAGFLLSIHTPGSPAKFQLEEVAASYRIGPGPESGASRRKFASMCLALSRCDLLCTNSSWTARILERVYRPALNGRFPPIVAECVGIDLEGLEPPRFASPRPLKDRPVLLSIVRASPRKRWEGVLAAERSLKLEHGIATTWHVLCGEDRREIEASAGAEAGGFVFHDVIDDAALCQLWRETDLFIHPAHSEHLGLGILEALAQGIPVVASRSGGPPTYLVEGREASFFDPDDWEGLARVIGDVLAQPQFAATQARAGCRAMRARFSWDAVLNRLEPMIGGGRPLARTATLGMKGTSGRGTGMRLGNSPGSNGENRERDVREARGSIPPFLHLEEVSGICERLGLELRAALLFGSRARGTADVDSDADVLILVREAVELSVLHPVDGGEIHASILSMERAIRELPAKWWEPIASSMPLPYGPDACQLPALKAQAGTRWGTADSRRIHAERSARSLHGKLRELERHPGMRALLPARLRYIADGTLSLQAFVHGIPEPGKRRRISGLETGLRDVLPAGAWNLYLACMGCRPDADHALPALREAARLAWPHYIAWIDAHEHDPLLRSMNCGTNRWWQETEAAAAAGNAGDVRYYLGFVLNRLLTSSRQPELLMLEPWYTDLLAEIYSLRGPDLGLWVGRLLELLFSESCEVDDEAHP